MKHTTDYAIICNYGGLGDQIARAPAIKCMMDTWPELNLHIFIFPELIPLYTEWFGYKAHIYPIQAVGSIPDTWGVRDFSTSRYFQLGMHPTDLAFQVLMHRPALGASSKEYLPIIRERDPKYVLLSPTFKAASRSMPVSFWNRIAAQIRATSGHEVRWIGTTTEENGMFTGGLNEDEPVQIERIPTPSIEAAIQAIADSFVFVGVDGGLNHLAACVGVPSVNLYTTQRARLREPYASYVDKACINSESECGGQELWLRFKDDLNFNKCYLHPNGNCDHGFSVESIIRYINEYLSMQRG